MTAVAAPQAKGSTLRSTLRYVEAEHGAAAADAVLERLPNEERRRIESAGAMDEVPVELLRVLWDAVEGAVGKRDPGWPEKSGAYSIQSMGVQLYGGILRKRDPLEFLSQPVSLFRLYYQPGNMEVVSRCRGGRCCAWWASPATRCSADARRAGCCARWSWPAACAPPSATSAAPSRATPSANGSSSGSLPSPRKTDRFRDVLTLAEEERVQLW